MALPSVQVFLVGAGPGNPGLLTLRAVECLAQADLVLFDQLVPTAMLEHAPSTAERICVSDLPGCHPERWPHIHRTMIEAARQGKRVVRLKGGDPFLFGRGGEEAEALRQAGITYEVVPGVTAGLGASAYAGIPLTHRLYASAVAFITGHEQSDNDRSAIDWAALARFPGTLVIYMGIARLEHWTQLLIRHGKPADTPAAVIRRGTTGEQQTISTSLGQLATSVRAANLFAPALVVVGPVVALREQLAWFEKSPLLGKRILVTRPRQQAAGLMRRLELLGAIPSALPMVEIHEPADWTLVDQAIARFADFHWLVFTSANGVHGLLRRLRQTGRDLRALAHMRLAVIGPATAEALRSYYLEPDLLPQDFCSESLAAALRERAAGQRLLLARADRGRDVLRQELAQVAQVEQIAVYSQTDAVLEECAEMQQLRQGAMDYITLTSSNIAQALIRTLDAATRQRITEGTIRLVSISPITSAEIRRLGLPVAAEATSYTIDGMIEALIRLSEREANEREKQ